MKNARSVLWTLSVASLVISFSVASSAENDAALARDDRVAELERKVEILVEELGRVQAGPSTGSSNQPYVLSGGGRKRNVFGGGRLSLGGYGEAYYTKYLSDTDAGSTKNGDGDVISDRNLDKTDMYRLVTNIGYKFTDRLIFNGEIEFEHASAGGATESSKSGSASVELAAIDFLWRDSLNARAGMLLMPMGIINQYHEPPTFHGMQRPEVEKYLIPTTWRENGVGIFGKLGETLEYQTYLTAGFNAAAFSESGIRSGRQKGNRSLAEDISWIGRLDWTPVPQWLIGGSLYTGGSGQNQKNSEGVRLPGARLTMWDIHTQFRARGLELRGLFTMSNLSGAGALNRALSKSATKAIAERMLGGYAEVAYDIWPTITGRSDRSLSPFFRYEHIDTQNEMPSGYTATDSKTRDKYVFGVGYKPHPDVVVKVDYSHVDPDDGDKASELTFGIGFQF